ncbi:hypothetical protein NIES2135_25140 [Leptolyngbya boryana NIES-2135]|jgi:hypothetical protein|uniref:Uncharacterized protein n=1 Tax=Leptolyngbya boryana NIES-2135 TaxID=1973484 RepID=A0A1Z4JG46_LEPBY|nr:MULTISPECIES: hypothetical protein [Leptolyngbya]ULP32575.1 hypothetical protein MCP04_12560 [Leptolyngbya boryana IU 594]BAS58101.1 hypothetical protein LBWT_40650 [Leptolyngbya boryana IAM M-101]BAS64449.1 hypothetical protein LBDG_40650 [Leptolyngbya boryana dg5]BAY55690.1 hypothetical protein NIES2135_25140 [Leptolyngbya boryana NIES-2135]
MNKWQSLLAFCFTAAAICTITKPLQASTALPMTLSTSEGYYTMKVSDNDTTRSAYGGGLRVYDVHIAKMFEVTYRVCTTGRLSPGANWTYLAGNGSINMGNFYISCDLASDIAIAYGLGNPERTTILHFAGEEAEGEPRTEGIPILNITGGKIDRWMNFTRNFKPAR